MVFENWVPDLGAIDRESEYLTRQYGAAVAARYRKIALTPPNPNLDRDRRGRKSPKACDGRLTEGMKQVIRRQVGYGLSPWQIAKKWGIPVAVVRGVIEVNA